MSGVGTVAVIVGASFGFGEEVVVRDVAPVASAAVVVRVRGGGFGARVVGVVGGVSSGAGGRHVAVRWRARGYGLE